MALLPLPRKPPYGAGVIAGHPLASSMEKAILYNEGSGTIARWINSAGSGNGTLSGTAAWGTNASLGGTCMTTPADNDGINYGNDGLNIGNPTGGMTAFWIGRIPATAGRQHVAVEIAGPGTDGYFFGLGDLGQMEMVVADVVAIDEGSFGALTVGDIYACSVKYTYNVGARFYFRNLTTEAAAQGSNVAGVGIPQQTSNPSVTCNRRSLAGTSWKEDMALTYLWSRILPDSDIDTLIVSPYDFIQRSFVLS